MEYNFEVPQPIEPHPNIGIIDKKNHFLEILPVFSLIVFTFGIFSVIFFSLNQKDQERLISPISRRTNASTNTLQSISITPTVTIKKEKKQVIGFLPSWLSAKEVKVDVKKLDQLIYFGFGVNKNGELIRVGTDGRPVLEWQFFTSDYFKKLQQEAKENKTKVLISIKSFDNGDIDTLISSPYFTERFIQELKVLVKDYDLDGINLDFEYFTDIDFPTHQHLNKFLETVNQELKKENPNTILSFDVNATVVLNDKAYDMVKIGETVDEIIIMAYDYHRTDSTLAGPIAPLYGSANEHSIMQTLDSLVGRVPSEKIIVAIPFYGYEWQTYNQSFKSPTVANTGALATYKRVRELIESRTDEQIKWDEKSMTPWLVYTQSGAIKQIYYEDERSLEKKIEVIKERKLGGIGIWSLGYEGDTEELWKVMEKIR
jgi:spore germination protein